MTGEISVRVIEKKDVTVVQDFLLGLLKDLFGYDRHPVFHKDILELEEFYIKHPRHIMFGAYNNENQLVGTIAGRTFRDNFDCIKGRYANKKVLEVGRCFIDPSLRRCGIGSVLYDAFIAYCNDQAIEVVYLHTHRHLPGGFDFGQKKDLKYPLKLLRRTWCIWNLCWPSGVNNKFKRKYMRELLILDLQDQNE